MNTKRRRIAYGNSSDAVKVSFRKRILNVDVECSQVSYSYKILGFLKTEICTKSGGATVFYKYIKYITSKNTMEGYLHMLYSFTTNILPESHMDVARADSDRAFPGKYETPLELCLYSRQLPITAKIHVIHFKNHAGLHMYS